MKTFRTGESEEVPESGFGVLELAQSRCTRESREFAAEIKFVIGSEVADQIRCWARARLLPDPHGSGPCADGYLITSLYLDTTVFDVFNRRGSYGKSKHRIRRYGQSAWCFLERKLRTRGFLAKRRSVHPLHELELLDATTADRGWAGFWFHRRMLKRGLRPVCQVSYERIARMLMTDLGPARLTLDNDLRAVSTDEAAFSSEPGQVLMDGRCVLEMKFRGEVPALFKDLAAEFALSPQAFSKYRLAASMLHLGGGLEYDRATTSIADYV